MRRISLVLAQKRKEGRASPHLLQVRTTSTTSLRRVSYFIRFVPSIDPVQLHGRKPGEQRRPLHIHYSVHQNTQQQRPYCSSCTYFVMEYNGRKLPPGWVHCVSAKHGRVYFFDTQTGKSAWFAPTAADTAASGASTPGEPLEQEEPSSPPAKRSRQQAPSPPAPGDGNKDSAVGRRTKVAIIVPYRDLDPAQRRSAHLEQFVPYMEDFLSKAVDGGAAAEGVGEFHVYVVEQSADNRKFNRGKLLNIGFDLAKQEGCAAFLFHDVDLLPSDKLGR